MKYIFSFILSLGIIAGQSQTKFLPTWFIMAFKNKGLDKKYQLSNYLKPNYLQGNFNGDSYQDVAAFIFEKETKKKGIIIIHGNTLDYFVFGAGIKINNSNDNLKWANYWGILKENAIYYDSNHGKSTITDFKIIQLKYTAIEIIQYGGGEGGCGAVNEADLYWNGNKYVWLTQY